MLNFVSNLIIYIFFFVIDLWLYGSKQSVTYKNWPFKNWLKTKKLYTTTQRYSKIHRKIKLVVPAIFTIHKLPLSGNI